MLTSRDRILTTHVGSLPRNDVITELLIRREADSGTARDEGFHHPVVPITAGGTASVLGDDAGATGGLEIATDPLGVCRREGTDAHAVNDPLFAEIGPLDVRIEAAEDRGEFPLQIAIAGLRRLFRFLCRDLDQDAA